jgi:hypothetical protein
MYVCMYVDKCMSIGMFIYESSLLSGLLGELNKKEGIEMYILGALIRVCMSICMFIYESSLLSGLLGELNKNESRKG